MQLTNSTTGKSFSETLILASTNPQYDKRLLIELQVQYLKIASSEHVPSEHVVYTDNSLPVLLSSWNYDDKYATY